MVDTWNSWKKRPKKAGSYEVLVGKRDNLGILYMEIIDSRWDGRQWNVPEYYVVMKWRRQ